MKIIDILKAYIKFGTKLFHLRWEKKGKSNIRHSKNEKKGEFECLKSESLVFKGGYSNHVWMQGVMDTKNHNNKGWRKDLNFNFQTRNKTRLCD